MERDLNNEVIGIFGTGLAGQMVFQALNKRGIEVAFFLDGNVEKIGTNFQGRKILGIDSIQKEALILIAANPRYGIHNRLEEKGICNWKYIDPEYSRLWSEGLDWDDLRNFLKRNSEKINKVYDMLADDKSRKVLESVFKHRLYHDLSLIDEIYDENQYFGNDVIGSVYGNFVDCGAYTGDTLNRFVSQMGGDTNEYHYYAFEAEKENCESIMRYCRENGIKNVDIFNLAVFDKKGVFSFSEDINEEKVGGRINELKTDVSSMVQTDTIDNVLDNVKIDMITMDIEGAELHALKGAEKCIRSYAPNLAISAYHSIDHLWEIPLLIRTMNPAYRLFYRHHRWNMHDTVCYAITG